MNLSTRIAALAALSLFLVPELAHAQLRTRATTGRARMELAFDHGYGLGTEGDYLELGVDLRVHAAEGIGAVVRGGLALAPFSIAYVVEAGLAYRLDLFSSEAFGVQLAVAAGPSFAYGPFDRGEVPALGGWAMLGLDLWHRNFLFGIGVAGHALGVLSDGGGDNYAAPREGPLLTITPTLRVGGDWGL
ncbi:MAG: hypothetical protein KF729_24385 [Sandaracinaceae bacterium]|nr:hypothetical protein [Sandaracinaceae bacterium]